MTDNPKAAWLVVSAFGSAVSRGDQALDNIPGLLKRLLQEGAWQEFVTPAGELVEHDRFVDFLITPPTQGVGASVDLVRSLLRNDAEALDLLDQALQRPIGVNQHTEGRDNVMTLRGNSKDAALRRLRKDRPDLHARVLAEELSPHAAMVEAGFRHRTATVPVDDVEAIARALRRALSADTLELLIKHLSSEIHDKENI